MITITVICSQAQDRKNMTAILTKQDGFRIASTGKDSYDALKAAKSHKPDIIIMDFNTSGIHITDLALLLKRNSPSTNLIVLFSGNEHINVSIALRAGISGFLIKQSDSKNLVSSVQCVYHGGLYLSQSIKNNLLQQKEVFFSNNAITDKFFSVTDMRIFFGILLGYTDKEIAKNLNMCEGAVRNCITRVKYKTGLQNRTQMAVFALFAATMDRKSIKGQLAEIS